MPNEQNERVVRRSFDAWNGDLSAVDETVAEGAVGYDPALPEPTVGPEGVKQLVTMYREAFPDIKMEIVDIVSDGDKVVARWTASGTNTGELMGAPATGASNTSEGISIDRIENGKIVESWVHWDNLGMMRNLGLLGEPAGAAAS